jgi:hypothetical protein
MSLLDELKGVLSQYAAGTTPSGDTQAHFDTVSQGVNPSSLAQGLAAAFRSNETPPFAQMAAQMFAGGSPEQKANVLNTLLGSAPDAVRTELAKTAPDLGATGTISPQQAGNVSPDAIQGIARQVEQKDPSIVDKLSSVYANHPTLVRALGTTAMIVALRRIARLQQG